MNILELNYQKLFILIQLLNKLTTFCQALATPVYKVWLRHWVWTIDSHYKKTQIVGMSSISKQIKMNLQI